VFELPSTVRYALWFVALGCGWSCSVSSGDLFGSSLSDAGLMEPGGQSSAGSAGVPDDSEPATGDLTVPGAGGAQPTGTAPETGVPLPTAVEAPAPPVLEPELSSEQPDAATAAEPNQTPPDASGAEPVLPEPDPACGGTLLQGSCWYLSDVGQACEDVCALHGGFSLASAALIGTPAQGGSIEGCTAVLQVLATAPGSVNEGFREDGLGLGCHLFVEADATEVAWWLTSPDLSPQAFSAQSRHACGCVR
jgi:hypothetical protein